MAFPVAHSPCGLHTVASPFDDTQLVVKPLMFREAIVERTDDIISQDYSDQLRYDGDGHGHPEAKGEEEKTRRGSGLHAGCGAAGGWESSSDCQGCRRP